MKHVLFSFKGRISRKQFWLGTLAMMVEFAILFALMAMTFNTETYTPTTASLAITAVMFILAIWQGTALYVKRFHDRNKSGWWMLVGLIPLIGSFWLIIECGFLSGTQDSNRFGANPKLS